MNIFKRIWNFCWWICYSESYADWKIFCEKKEKELLDELMRKENETNKI